MYNISSQNNTVVINNGERTWAFPKGTIWLHGNSGEDQSVDVKLAASRQTIISFRYDDCNMAGADALETIQNIIQII